MQGPFAACGRHTADREGDRPEGSSDAYRGTPHATEPVLPFAARPRFVLSLALPPRRCSPGSVHRDGSETRLPVRLLPCGGGTSSGTVDGVCRTCARHTS